MGLKCSPDYAQKIMENIFHDVNDAEVYINDIGAFSNSWEEHMTLISKILTLLQDNGLQSTHLSVNGQSKKMIGLQSSQDQNKKYMGTPCQ
jgi:hypothetical protein